MKKLKVSEVAKVRAELLAGQGGRCGICNLRVLDKDAVLDHDHASGVVRATLHRGCNSLLGKVENNYARYGVPNLSAWAHGFVKFLQKHTTPQTEYLHPTHRTDDEKRDRRNAKARAKRATNKEKA